MIPKDWDFIPLEQLASVERGKFTARPRNDPRYYGGSIPFVQTGDVAAANGLIQGYTQTLNEEGLSVSKLFPKGSILITIAANIGEVAMTSIDVACPDSIVVVQAKSSVCREWLKYALVARKPVMEAAATQNAQKNINLQVLRPLPIPTPSKEEQYKIAEVLEVWDEAIATTEKLIAAKQRRKKAFVQRYFIQRKLSTSSNCNYKCFQFKEIVESYIDYRGRTPLKIGMQWGGGGIKALSANNVQMGFVDFAKECYLGSEELYRKWMVNGDCERGDVLLTTEAPLGNVAQIPDDEKYILSQRVVLIKPKVSLIHKDYLFQFMMSEIFQTELQKNSSGSTAVGIQRKRLDKIPVVIPSIEEQKKIASILYSADLEIRKQKQQLELIKIQKRGLMQKLLTGEWRVKIKETAAQLAETKA